MMRRRQHHRRIGGEDVRNPNFSATDRAATCGAVAATITSHSCAAEVNVWNCVATVASII
jgi:hypothetical protein